MIMNCDGCRGERRIQCDAIFMGVRDEAGLVATDLLTMGDRMVGLFEISDRGRTVGSKAIEGLRGIGCELSETQVTGRLVSEADAGIFLRLNTAEEETATADQERADRISGLVEQIGKQLTGIQSALNTSDQGEAEKERRAEEFARQYCEAEGWDIDNLQFYQRMDLRARLREQDLL